MKAADFDKFSDGLSGVYGFYSKEVSTFALDVWWTAMRPFDLSAVIDAFNRHLVNPDAGQWLPKPADLIRMLGGRTQDQALVAWSKVDKAVRSVGTYSSVVFDDPLIHRVLCEMGDWIALGQKTENEWPFVAREFETRYRGYAMRSELPDYPPVLIGLAEARNGLNGIRVDPPRLIGNAERALAVMDGGDAVSLIGSASASDRVIKRLRDRHAA